MYKIKDLDNIIDQLNGHLSDKKLISELESKINELAFGVSVPPAKRAKLYHLLQNLQNSSIGEIKTSSRKVMSKIRGERKRDAEGFYDGHGKTKIKNQVNFIDFSHEIVISRITPGKSLYQWCKMIINNDGHSVATLFDRKTNICTVGQYFSSSIVEPSQLGISGYFDIEDYDEEDRKKYFTTAQQTLCRFTFPFEVDCLISIAKGAVDRWNVSHYSNGNEINKIQRNDEIVNKYGIWGEGGARQYFVPLTDNQRIELAKIAEFV